MYRIEIFIDTIFHSGNAPACAIRIVRTLDTSDQLRLMMMMMMMMINFGSVSVIILSFSDSP